MTTTAATVVSTREVPWMKIGKLTESPMTAAEAARQGGLNFEVVKAQLTWTYDNDHMSGNVTDRVALIRRDTWTQVGFMSKNYPILQYREAFDFMDTVNPTYVAAGCLKGGRQGFMVVKAPTNFHMLENVDPHDLYVVLRTSHDGSRGIEICVMPLRQRCMNQLTLQSFSAGVPHRWSITHNTSMHKKLASAQETLSNVGAYATAFGSTVQKLLKITITVDAGRALLETVLPARPRRDDQIDQILTAWSGSDTVGFAGRGWGLVNSVSEYFDWGRVGGSPESRFVGALQGATTTTINRVAGRLLSRA
jgi:phage/plasmid-like protein (TIGR03299 family)